MKDFLDEYGTMIISCIGFGIIIGIIINFFMGGAFAKLIINFMEGAI